MPVVGEQVIHTSSIGMDVHRDKLVCCFGYPGEDKEIHNEVISFSTHKKALHEELVPWVLEKKPEIVVMESTGIYWRPVYYALEEYGISMKVVNARHVRMIPGKKTDTEDAVWLSQLARLGYLRSSFIPPKEWREVIELNRSRQQFLYERTSLLNRMVRQLYMYNCNLKSVFSSASGKNAMTAIRGIIAGNTPEQIINSLELKRLKHSREEILLAIDSCCTENARFILSNFYELYNKIDDSISQIDEIIDKKINELASEEYTLLISIPGISSIAARTILAETGNNIKAFPSAKHFSSWLGLCPGNKESAGKRYSGKIRKGNIYIRRVLCEAAHAASRTRNTTLGSKFEVLRARLGFKKAIVAMAHKLARIVYSVLKNRVKYRDAQINYVQIREAQTFKSKLRNTSEQLAMEIHVVHPLTGEKKDFTPNVPLSHRSPVEQMSLLKLLNETS